MSRRTRSDTGPGMSRSERRAATAAVVEGFLSRLAFGVVSLALPLYALHLGMGAATVGLLLSANIVVQLVAKPVMGRVVDRTGPRAALVVAIVVRACVPVMLLLAAQPWHLFAARGVYGVAQSLRDPALNVVISDAGGKKHVARAFSWYHTAKNVAASVGRATAGVLITLAAGYRGAFLVAAVLGLLPLLPVLLAVPGRRRRAQAGPAEDAGAQTSRPGWEDTGALYLDGAGSGAAGDVRFGTAPFDRMLRLAVARRTHRSRRTARGGAAAQTGAHARHVRAAEGSGVAPFTALAFLSGTTAGLMNLFPVIAVTSFGLTEAQIGFVMLASTVVVIGAGPFFGRLADTVNRRAVLRVRAVANCASSLLYLAVPALPMTFATTAVARGVDDVGKAAFRPAWGSVMAEVAASRPGRRGSTLALIELGEDAGDAIGPALAGLLMAVGGLPALLLTRAALAVVTEVWTRRVEPAPAGPTDHPPDVFRPAAPSPMGVVRPG